MKKVTIKKPAQRYIASASELVADYKARNLSKQAAWNEFIKDRGLRPEIDAKDVYKLYDTVIPCPLEHFEEIEFEATHAVDFGDHIEGYVMVTDGGNWWNLVFSWGSTGTQPKIYGLPDYFKPL